MLTELGRILAALFVSWCLGVRPVGHLASHEDTETHGDTENPGYLSLTPFSAMWGHGAS